MAVLDSKGKLIILETKAATILEFLAGLRGTLSVSFEEGTLAAGLYDVLKAHVDKLGGVQSAEERFTQRWEHE